MDKHFIEKVRVTLAPFTRPVTFDHIKTFTLLEGECSEYVGDELLWRLRREGVLCGRVDRHRRDVVRIGFV